MLYQDRDGPLLTGERVLWKGRPHRGILFQRSDIFVIPFSLLWASVALTGAAASLRSADTPLEFQLFSAMFGLLGLYFVVGRFFVDMWMRSQRRYFVTDRRILIVTSGLFHGTKSLDLKRLPALDLSERGDGTGTIRFGDGGGLFNGRNMGLWSPAFDSCPQFLRIENVRSIYELIDRQTEAR